MAKWTVEKTNSVLTFLALLVIIGQTWLSREQFKLQEETANRSWSAELLATIYSDPPLPPHVRQEAVLAYLRHQRTVEKGEVRLSGANLAGMHLDEEIFIDADLSNANMKGCFLNRADLEGANLSGTDLTNAELNGTKLNDSQLNGAKLADAKLRGSDLSGSNLRGTRFNERFSVDLATGFVHYHRGAYVMGVDFTKAEFDQSTEFCAVNAEGAKLGKAIGLKRLHIDCATVNYDTTLPPGIHHPLPTETGEENQGASSAP